MKKKGFLWFAALLCSLMLFSVGAGAEGFISLPENGVNWTEVGTNSTSPNNAAKLLLEAVGSIEADSTAYLKLSGSNHFAFTSADGSVAKAPLIIKAGTTVFLDLNSKNVFISNKSTAIYAIQVEKNATLVILDSSEGHNGSIYTTKTEGQNCIKNSGTVQLLSGHIAGSNVSENDTGYAINNQKDSYFYVSGGFLDNRIYGLNSAKQILINGGTFVQDVSKLVADGYYCEKEPSNNYVVKKYLDVTVGSAPGSDYALLSALIEELPMINKVKSVTLSSNISDNVVIPAGEEFTLNLSGFSLTGQNTGNVIKINESDISIINGTIQGKADAKLTANGGIIYNNKGTLVLGNNLTIKGCNPGTKNGGGIYDYGGNTTIDGAIIEGSGTKNGNALYAGSTSTVLIKSGTIKGGVHGYNIPLLRIISGAIDKITGSGNIMITGGVFGADPSDYVPFGYTIDEFGNNPKSYSVLKNSNGDVAIGELFGSLPDAISYASSQTSAVTILILKDIDNLKSALSFNGGTITIDLNGYTLSQNGNRRFAVITGGSTVTIKDSGSNGCIKLKKTTATGNIRVEEKSTLVLESGTVTAADGIDITSTENGGAIYVIGATFEMTGGTISNCNTEKNSGAVQLAKKSIDDTHPNIEPATFTMTGGTIENCTAAGHGAAVSVGSECTFTMEGGTIQNCSSKTDYSVYVDWSEDYNYTYGTFNMSEGAGISRPDAAEEATATVRNLGYFTNETGSDVTTDNAPDSKLVIGLNVTDSFVPIVNLLLSDACLESFMEPTSIFLNFKDQKVSLEWDSEEKSCVYADGVTLEVTPEYLAEDITVTDEDDCYPEKKVSIEQYLVDTYNDKKSTAELKNLCAAILNYGKESRDYAISSNQISESDAKAYTFDSNITSNISSEVLETKKITDAKRTTEGENNTTVRVKSASLVLGSKISMKFHILSGNLEPDNINVSVFGADKVSLASCTKEAEGLYSVTVEDISPLDYGNDNSTNAALKVFNGDTELVSVKYNVNSYAASKQKDETVGNLAKAIYAYGEAAKAYDAT